jgi:hypothetical protein
MRKGARSSPDATFASSVSANDHPPLVYRIVVTFGMGLLHHRANLFIAWVLKAVFFSVQALYNSINKSLHSETDLKAREVSNGRVE